MAVSVQKLCVQIHNNVTSSKSILLFIGAYRSEFCILVRTYWTGSSILVWTSYTRTNPRFKRICCGLSSNFCTGTGDPAMSSFDTVPHQWIITIPVFYLAISISSVYLHIRNPYIIQCFSHKILQACRRQKLNEHFYLQNQIAGPLRRSLSENGHRHQSHESRSSDTLTSSDYRHVLSLYQFHFHHRMTKCTYRVEIFRQIVYVFTGQI